jgi:pseudouridine synthase
VNLDPSVRYLALHKPAGVVTTMDDPQGRRDIRELLPDDGSRVFPVGRLDRDSEGLLLAMNDGDLANALTHPRYGIEKEYLVEVEGSPGGRHLGALRGGVDLDDGPARARSVRIVDARPGRAQLALVMTEGRKREVRRMLEALELPVRRLLRVRIGPVHLGHLTSGDRRDLTADELLALGKLVARAERRLRRSATDAL